MTIIITVDPAASPSTYLTITAPRYAYSTTFIAHPAHNFTICWQFQKKQHSLGAKPRSPWRTLQWVGVTLRAVQAAQLTEIK